LPRTPLGTGEIGNDRPPDHLEPIAHARQQPIELLITQVDLAGEELADARLANPAEARQLRLGGAGLEHHLPQQVTSVRHALTIAKNTMGSFASRQTPCQPSRRSCPRPEWPLPPGGLRRRGSRCRA